MSSQLVEILGTNVIHTHLIDIDFENSWLVYKHAYATVSAMDQSSLRIYSMDDSLLYIGNLPDNGDETMIREVFSKFLTVTVGEIRLALTPEGRFMGYAFGKLDSKVAVAKAVEECNGKDVGGKHCFLDSASNHRDLWDRAFGK